MKTVFMFIGCVFMVLVLLIGGERWDEQRNRGHTWGYWGEFNRVSNTLASLPAVTVVQGWCNADFLALEEFGFDIRADGRDVKLVFGEKDPVRKLSGSKLQEALLEIIRKQSSKHSIQRMPASRLAKRQLGRHCRLARTADGDRSGQAL